MLSGIKRGRRKTTFRKKPQSGPLPSQDGWLSEALPWQHIKPKASRLVRYEGRLARDRQECETYSSMTVYRWHLWHDKLADTLLGDRMWDKITVYLIFITARSLFTKDCFLSWDFHFKISWIIPVKIITFFPLPSLTFFSQTSLSLRLC